ncbi:twin-arginine translocation pathway signal protein [Candidatus Poribacteria bacterium]|nr:MAG: twin-arginine translocation pathway signal protein [Candidatus Poribacteria bacterium]
MANHVLNLSRRNFLGTSGVLVLGTTLRPAFASQDPSPFNANLFVTVHPNNTVEIISHRSEMGQGIRTAVAQVVADELDANWDDVVVGQALGDVRYGDQNTDGSKSIRTNLDRLREAGASARQMLINAAAKEWKTDAAFLSTKDGYVYDQTKVRKASYGELSSVAATLSPPKSVELKKRRDFKFIGAGVIHVDADAITKGGGTYGADVRLPNMVFAVIKRAPALGQTVEEVTVSELIKDDPRYIGIETIAPTPGAPLFFPVGGVAVIATDTYAALTFSEQIDISWSSAPTQSFDSELLEAQLREMVSNPSKLVHQSGDVDKIFTSSSNIVERTYETAFLSHAPMEPPVALADVQGESVNVWAPVQDPQNTQGQIAGWLKTNPQNIRVNVTLLGGAFGRKSKPDFVLEAVELSQRLSKPVRVQWSRENDIQYDYFHAPSAQLYKASLGADNKPSAWLQRTAFPSIGTTFDASASEPANWELDMGFTKTPYLFANQRFEADGVRAGVRIGWLRSVCNIFHAFGANVFVDELAHEAGMDPIDYRMAIWPTSGLVNDPGMPAPPGHEFDIGRLRNVLTQVREMSNWDTARQQGKNLGVAVHHSFYSYVACVLEVDSLPDPQKVTNAWMVLDCGTYVNADTCVAQMEGAVVFGLSLAQKSKISMKNGKVEQDNFDSYQLLRINEAPDVEVHLVHSTAEPAGVGEPGVPPVAPALSNALFQATGVRHRKLPIA